MNARIQNLIAVCFAACATTMYAADERGMTGFYAIGDLDANLVHDVGFVRIIGFNTPGFAAEIKPGIRGTVGIGYAFLPQLGAELEAGFSYNQTRTYSGSLNGDFLSGSADAWVVPVTVGLTYRPTFVPTTPSSVEIDYGQKFFQNLRPFVGAGVGVANVFGELELNSALNGTFRDSGWDTEFTYYAKAGLTYAVSPKVEIGFQYRFWGFSGFTIKSTQSEDIYAHAVGLVVHVKF